MKRLILAVLLPLLLLSCSRPGYNIRSSGVTYGVRDASGFLRVTPVKGADPKTFEDIDGIYAKDQNHLFRRGVLLEESKPEGFRLLDKDFYATDGERVYAGPILISHDLEHFEILPNGYARDSERAFYLGHPLEGSHSASWESIDGFGSYAKDQNQVYREGRTIEGAQPEGFEPLNYYYSRDPHKVFYEQAVLEGADPASFTTRAKCQLGQDSQSAWYRDFHLEKLDGSKTVILEDLYCKDDQHVYFGNKLIEGADAESFETFSQNGAVYGRDKNREYTRGRPRS